MTERNFTGVRASSIHTMPSAGVRWIMGEVEGGGDFQLDVSNTEPTMTLKVTIPGVGEQVERIDVTELLTQWVHGMVRDATRNLS